MSDIKTTGVQSSRQEAIEQQQQQQQNYANAFADATARLGEKGFTVAQNGQDITVTVGEKTYPVSAQALAAIPMDQDQSALTRAIISTIVGEVRNADAAAGQVIRDQFAADGVDLTTGRTSNEAATTQGVQIPQTGSQQATETLTPDEIAMWTGTNPGFRADGIKGDYEALRFLTVHNDSQIHQLARTDIGRAALTNMHNALDEGWTKGSEYDGINRIWVGMATARPAEGGTALENAHGDEGKAAIINAMINSNQTQGTELLAGVIQSNDTSLVAEVFANNPRALNKLDDGSLARVAGMSAGENASSSQRTAIDQANAKAESLLVERANTMLAGNGQFDMAALAEQDSSLAVRIINGADPTQGPEQFNAMLAAYPGAVERLSTDKLLQIADTLDNEAVLSELTERYTAELREPGVTGFEAMAANHPVAMHKMLMQEGFRESVVNDASRWGEGQDRRDLLAGINTLLGQENRAITPQQKGALATALLNDPRMNAMRGRLDVGDSDALRDNLQRAVSQGEAAARAQETLNQRVAQQAEAQATYDASIADAKAAVEALNIEGLEIEISGEKMEQTATITLGDNTQTVALPSHPDTNLTELLTGEARAMSQQAVEQQAAVQAAETARVAEQQQARWSARLTRNAEGLRSIGVEVPEDATGEQIMALTAEWGTNLTRAGFDVLGPSEKQTGIMVGWGRADGTGRCPEAVQAMKDLGITDIQGFLLYAGNARAEATTAGTAMPTLENMAASFATQQTQQSTTTGAITGAAAIAAEEISTPLEQTSAALTAELGRRSGRSRTTSTRVDKLTEIMAGHDPAALAQAYNAENPAQLTADLVANSRVMRDGAGGALVGRALLGVPPDGREAAIQSLASTLSDHDGDDVGKLIAGISTVDPAIAGQLLEATLYESRGGSGRTASRRNMEHNRDRLNTGNSNQAVREFVNAGGDRSLVPTRFENAVPPIPASERPANLTNLNMQRFPGMASFEMALRDLPADAEQRAEMMSGIQSAMYNRNNSGQAATAGKMAAVMLRVADELPEDQSAIAQELRDTALNGLSREFGTRKNIAHAQSLTDNFAMGFVDGGGNNYLAQVDRITLDGMANAVLGGIVFAEEQTAGGVFQTEAARQAIAAECRGITADTDARQLATEIRQNLQGLERSVASYQRLMTPALLAEVFQANGLNAEEAAALAESVRGHLAPTRRGRTR